MKDDEMEKRNAANEARLKARQAELDEKQKQIDLKYAQLEASDSDLEMYHGLNDNRIFYLVGGIILAAAGFVIFVILN